MCSIKKQTKLAVDRQLDEGLPHIPSDHLEQNLIDLLRYIECYWRFTIPYETSKHGTAENVLSSRALNASGLAISLCCKQRSEIGDIQWLDGQTSENEVRTWQSIFACGLRYSDMCDWMHNLWHESYPVEQLTPTEFSFSYPDTESKSFEAAEWFLKELEAPLITAAYVDPAFLLKEIAQAAPKDHELLLRIPTAVLQRVQEWVAAQQATCWKLDGTIVLDGFELSEYRKFWTALSTLVSVHRLAWNNAVSDDELRVSVPIVKQEELLLRLQQLSGQSIDKIRFLTKYITCNVEIWSIGKFLNAVLQPIFPIGNSHLALSTSLILEANPERNILDLVNQKDSTVYDKIKDLKEQRWSIELEESLSGYGLAVKPQMKYSNTKMDLMVIDKNRPLGLTCELKWILTPERFKQDDIDYVNHGFEQALEACDWATNNKELVAEKLGLSKNSLQAYKFEPLLICKDTVLNGLARNERVPIICGRLFNWVIRRTQGDLAALFYVAKEKTFLPIEGTHFQERKLTLEFNGIKFHVVGLDRVPGSTWNPDRDIRLPLAIR